MYLDLGFSDDRLRQIAWAIDTRNDTAIDQSLKGEIPLNEPGGQGVTLLIYALANRYKYGVQRLLATGANPNYVGPKGDSAVTLSAGSDDPELLRVVLAGGGDPNLLDGKGRPATFVAAQQQRWENVETLLDAGADLEAKDRSEETLLLFLALYNHYEQAVALLERGANPKAANRIGITLAHRVESSRLRPDSDAERWRLTVIEMLGESGIPYPPLRPVRK